MGKLSLGAMVYAIWRERNNKIFSKGNLSKKEIKENVRRMVRDKYVELTNISLNTGAENIVRR